MSDGGLQPGDPARVGRYSLLRRLGVGGMGNVYRAYDPELDRQIALKLVTKRGDDDLDTPLRLVREARAMAKISHPNVAAVYDVGIIGRVVYIAMELLEGPTLSRWTQDTPRPWTEVLNMYLQAARGLAAAHDAGLVHRDFKPDNVMLGADERPRVLDFGLARPAPLDGDDQLLSDAEPVFISEVEPDAPLRPRPRQPSGSFDLGLSVTQHGLISGTPAYMAPEQHLGQDGGPAADQFAFCVALWEALFRTRPFEGSTYFEISDAIIEGRRRPVPAQSRVPAWLCAILDRGLAPDPRARHPSMRALMASAVFTIKIIHGLT